MTKVKTELTHYFEGMGQVFFLKNRWFGLGLLLTFIVGDWKLAVSGIASSVIAHWYSVRISTPKILRDTGLITVNGFFLGLAMEYLFQPSPQYFFCLWIGALAIPPVSKACYEVLQHWKVSPLMLPYILVVWVIWLCGNRFNLLPSVEAYNIETVALPILHPDWDLGKRLLTSVFISMGRLLFLPSPVFGFLLFIFITSFSPRRGLYFFAGTAAAALASFYMSAGLPWWEHGSLSYSAGLVGLGLASLPEKFSWRTIFFFCVVSFFLTMALSQILIVLRLPTLSLPYVMTFWVAILSRTPRLNISWAVSK